MSIFSNDPRPRKSAISKKNDDFMSSIKKKLASKAISIAPSKSIKISGFSKIDRVNQETTSMI